MVAALALLLGLGPTVPAGAQATSEVALEIVQLDVDAHPEVAVTVAAPPALVGKAIPPEAFEVRENGALRPVTVGKLRNDTLEVILVIDVSGSMAGNAMASAKAAARGFVEQMPPGTRVGVVAFGSSAAVASPFETDPAILARVIDGLQARGETALYDALTATVQVAEQGASGARRAVVLLSDGGDTVSTTSLGAVLALLEGLDADFFAVALATSEADAGALEQLAGAAAGQVVAADDPVQLAGVYDAIAARLVNQYELVVQSHAEGAADFEITVNFEGVVATATQSVELPALPGSSAASPAGRSPGIEVAGGAAFLEAGWTLIVGAALFAVAFGLAGWFSFSNREFRRRLAREYERGAGGLGAAATNLSERASAFAERVLEERGRAGPLNAALERAGLAMRPGEFIVLAAASAASAGVLGLVLGGFLVAVAFAGVTAGGFRYVLGLLADRRRAKFADQLSDTLQLLAGSLRSGYGLTQAIDAVAREAPSPTCDEFRRLVVESRLGRDLGEGLRGVADRAGNEDFHWVVQAMDIHREVGGDLAEILDQVGETIRDRNRVRRQVKALSAEGRLSAVILFVLPFVMAGVIRTTNPEYFGELTGTSAGKIMLGLGASLMVAGGIWLRNIVKLEF